MLDHTGKQRIRFEDTFRALGQFLDQQNFTQVTIVETPDGFLVKGYQLHATSAGYVSEPATYLFTDEDIDMLLEGAYQRRDQK